jgi:hypothetical protein
MCCLRNQKEFLANDDEIGLRRHRSISHFTSSAFSGQSQSRVLTVDSLRGALMQYVFCIICISNDPTPNFVRSRIFSFVGSMFRPAIDCVGDSLSKSSSLS